MADVVHAEQDVFEAAQAVRADQWGYISILQFLEQFRPGGGTHRAIQSFTFKK
ncbi:MAG TPA: hypothetical protein VKB02_04505 [Pyrinomonadaceae bacterium]|nr:hypothetical protein [Pyrinomonadaceae bacterium]